LPEHKLPPPPPPSPLSAPLGLLAHTHPSKPQKSQELPWSSGKEEGKRPKNLDGKFQNREIFLFRLFGSKSDRFSVQYHDKI